MLGREQYYMELLLVYEVKEWEQLFWTKFKAFLNRIENDRVEEKERLAREWRADCWKRLNSQMLAAQKRFAKGTNSIPIRLANLAEPWASFISQFFMVEDSHSMSLSGFKKWMDSEYCLEESDEIRLRMEKEIEDTEFRLKRGSDLGRFDQFWDNDSLFNCRYSRSKWLYLRVDLPLHWKSTCML